jgi:hypothetical protein
MPSEGPALTGADLYENMGIDNLKYGWVLSVCFGGSI